MLLVGCVMPTVTLQPTSIPTAIPDPLAYIDDLLPNVVLIQLSYRGSPESYSLYLEVPQFTLYADGTVLYLGEYDGVPAVMEAHRGDAPL